ncbi:MAG: hypothetical protein QOF71_3294 [Candidatus Eremiobacteraeota bacterium]|jgi:hypothetical protein|nr:hypothetical protein [Candidatus Eremiobacteraeota bacterium]
MRSPRLILALVSLSGLLAACNGGSASPPTLGSGNTFAFRFTESVGQFYRDYTGPQRPALNAIAADGSFVSASQTIVLTAKMAGPVFAGGPNYFVWGIDRGGATSAPFPDEPNVKFNAVVVVTADPANGTALTAVVNLLNGAQPQTVAAGLLAPDTIQVVVPASALPATGTVAASQYQWNLWPRNGLGGTAAAQIASFIPDNALATLLQQ